jgi:DNA-binding PadR family transcriptional regulator
LDVRTICLGILTRGDATGYEIKKLFEDSRFSYFVEASFGSIYPALSRLTEEGLVSVREEAGGRRPDRKVYSITEKGRGAFVASLGAPLMDDRFRSPFLFAMMFSDFLDPGRLRSPASAAGRATPARRSSAVMAGPPTLRCSAS